MCTNKTLNHLIITIIIIVIRYLPESAFVGAHNYLLASLKEQVKSWKLRINEIITKFLQMHQQMVCVAEMDNRGNLCLFFNPTIET